ncbi:MAG TPA: glycosyltransferase [Noviherbaspirillum sp.]|nr:glycosyltransferase [Noviherbaspirillum sp.]
MDATGNLDWRHALQAAHELARHARFDAFLAACQKIIEARADDAEALLAVASLLGAFGFVSGARQCYFRMHKPAPADLRPIAGLANVARDCGEHAESRRLYSALLQRRPDDPVVRRNALMSMEYDPEASDAERLDAARRWGVWAVAQAGGKRERPPLPALDGRPLRVGYVSADFCQHTVGLFVKDVLLEHDRQSVTSYAYSAGKVDDWVTAKIRHACTFRDIADLDDDAVAEQVRRDGIDVLVDLSGHTAGSRLAVFAQRPAPVQVSWLGYFATTGLAEMDAVLLDAWHAPQGTEAQFVERIVTLPHGRFCYTPVHFAPRQVAPPPSTTSGRLTFGCFNNTGKLNDAVLATWARILAAVPDSRLVLKWRTFQDAGLCESVRSAFARLGVAPDRVALRGASFHADLLKEYGDIDIALDPFPFSGGLTSCEALWMGVPVVTWPQGRVVSRQTFAFLSAIGLPEFAAQDDDHYVQIAVDLANDRERLAGLRFGLRDRMRKSPLCDVPTFTRGLEQAFRTLAQSAGTS